MRAKAPVQTLAAIRRGAAQGRQAADRELASGLQRRADDFGIDRPRDRPVPALRIEGYVIVSADGMLANAGQRHAGRTEVRGRQAVLHRRPRPRRPDRARPQFLRGPAELAAAQADRPDPQGRRDRARSVQSQSHPVESRRRIVRGRLRRAPACVPAPSRSSAGPACSACSWTATTRSGSRRRRACGCRRRALLPRRARALAAGNSGRARAAAPASRRCSMPADDVSVTPWRRNA